MAKDDQEKPRTHKWVRRDGVVRRPAREPQAIRARVPGGAGVASDELASAIRASLAGWPIIILRVVGHAPRAARMGRHPGRWIRTQLGVVIDEGLGAGLGDRCTDPKTPAYRLLGRHGIGPKPDGEAWSPLVLRAAGVEEGEHPPGSPVTFELVLAGRDATSEAAALVGSLYDPPEAFALEVSTVQALLLDEDGEPRWRKLPAEPTDIPHVALDLLTEPRVRSGRMVLNFASATPMARQGEEGLVNAQFGLVVDRMCRSFGAWMGRTGHKGPRMPVDDILRAAAAVETVNDTTRQVEIPVRLLAAEGVHTDERVPALLGAATYRGDFVGMAPLFRAAFWLGMGPGRQHGLGQVTFR